MSILLNTLYVLPMVYISLYCACMVRMVVLYFILLCLQGQNHLELM